MRTISKELQSSKRSRGPEVDEKTAIMYDPLNRTVFQGSIAALKSERKQSSPSDPQTASQRKIAYIEIPIKDCKTKVDIRIPLRRSSMSSQDAHHTKGSDGHGVYLATVDLRRLGKSVRNGVRSGKIKNVYVLGYVPDTLLSDESAEDSESD
jgi:hypothetical protein